MKYITLKNGMQVPQLALGCMRIANKDQKDVDALIAKGDLKPIVEWLTEKIYRFGCIKKPDELIRDICGQEFDAQYYVDYLTEKFTALYDLK